MPPSPPPPATTGNSRLSPTVSVVIPALNEETNLPLVLEGLPPVDEVVIVDGGSADDTVTVAREVRPDVVVIRQTRTGKGNALICGFAASRGEIVVTLNADGSTDPGEIPRYIDALISGAEVAHGSRYREGGGNLVGRKLDRLGNALLSRLVNALFGTRFTDLGYGYNAYWRVLLPVLDLPGVDVPGLRRGQRLWGDGPEIEPMINIRVAAQGMRVVEVASIGYPPINGVRERRMLRRALRALRAAAAEYARRWRIGRPATSAGTGPRHGTASGPAPHLGFGPPAARGPQDTDTGSQQRFTDTGSHPRGLGADTGSQQRVSDTGSIQRFGDTDTGSQQWFRDTGSRQRHLGIGSHLRSVGDDQREPTGAGGGAGEETVGRPRPRRAGLPDKTENTDSGVNDRRKARGDRAAASDENTGRPPRPRPSRRETTGIGQDDWRTSTGGGRRPDWRETTDMGQWQDLTGAAKQNRSDGPRYDPAAAQQQPQHDLDPAARRSLPMYPDPSWTEASGRHAEHGEGPTDRRAPRQGRRSAADEPESEPEPEPERRAQPVAVDRRAERGAQPGAVDRRRYRSGTNPTPWQGSTSDSGPHHRIEPNSDDGPRSPSGDGPSGHSPTGHSPTGHSPSGHSPTGHSPSGHSPTGHSPGGNGPSGSSPSGHSPTRGGPSGPGPTGLGPIGVGETDLGDRRGWARADLGATTERDVGGRRQRLDSRDRRGHGLRI